MPSRGRVRRLESQDYLIPSEKGGVRGQAEDIASHANTKCDATFLEEATPKDQEFGPSSSLIIRVLVIDIVR